MYLLATHSERKSQAESLDALMRAMVQLPSYLERVLAGGRDLALVLLPLLNDLRAVRGNALLSEGTLLLLNLKSDQQAQPQASAPGEAPPTIEHWARRVRARYQVGLIGWIRGERVEQNLAILGAVAHKLEQIATRQPVFQLWWVIGAVIEALQEKGLEGGQSIKRLLGLGDREIRRLYEQGEARYAQSPPVELLNNLLYYIGRSESAGARVTAVRASFRLSELLPVDESIEQERENLSAPSVKLMRTVAAAIREDLGKVKDVLDIFVRRGAGQPQELSSQVEMLRKIGDTLGVLGLGEARAVEVIEAITTQLRRVMQPRVHVLPPGFVDRLADAIVSLEYYMETVQAGRSDPWYMLDNAQSCVQALEQQPTPSVPTVAPFEAGAYARTVQIPSLAPPARPRPDLAARGAAAPAPAASSRADAAPARPAHPGLLKLFIEEAQEELTRIQHCFPVWDHNPLERDSLVTVRRSFHTLKGSGRMVGARELSEFAWAIENLLNRLLDHTLSRTPPILEALRAAVGALPELITQLRTREPLRTDVSAIAARAHELAAGRPAAARSPEQAEEEALEPPPAPSAPAGPRAAGQSPPARAPSPPPAAHPAPALTAARETVPDDTLRDIYARETAAHVATVRGYLARGSQLPEPPTLPQDVYRACHTLSGSSKMAQARHGIRLAEPLDHWLRRAYR